MKYEKRLNIENSAMQGDTWTVCVCVCGRRGPPVVGSEAGSQSDARLSFLQAGGRVHTAGAAGARVRGESSRLVVLNGGKQTVITP